MLHEILYAIFVHTHMSLLSNKPAFIAGVDIWAKKATIHQLTVMLATSSHHASHVLLPGYNHLLTTGADDPTLLTIARAPAREIIEMKDH